MKLCVYIMPSETMSTVYLINHSSHNTAASQIVLLYWLHYAYILKFYFCLLYQILRLQWKKRRWLVLPRTSCYSLWLPHKCSIIVLKFVFNWFMQSSSHLTSNDEHNVNWFGVSFSLSLNFRSLNDEDVQYFIYECLQYFIRKCQRHSFVAQLNRWFPKATNQNENCIF
jgi:hypothetical protein